MLESTPRGRNHLVHFPRRQRDVKLEDGTEGLEPCTYARSDLPYPVVIPVIDDPCRRIGADVDEPAEPINFDEIVLLTAAAALDDATIEFVARVAADEFASHQPVHFVLCHLRGRHGQALPVKEFKRRQDLSELPLGDLQHRQDIFKISARDRDQLDGRVVDDASQRAPGDDPERAFGPDEEIPQVVARIVLHERGRQAQVQHSPSFVREHDL